MRLFKDREGREWRVEINVTQVKRVRSLAGVDLFKVGDDWLKRFADLLSDVVLLADVLYVLCMDQAREEQVSDEDFGRGLFGDALGHAADAFARELVDFFPDGETRALLLKVLDKEKELRRAAAGAGQEGLRKMDVARAVEALQKKLEAQAGAVNGSPTTAPAASGSTPAR